jgi:hypothetical protein
MISFRSRRLLAIAALPLAAACTVDSSVGPSTPATPDRVLTEMSLPAVSRSPTVSFNMINGAAQFLPSAGCSYSAATQRFDCPSVASSGFTITQWFMLLDAGGAPLSSWDPEATAAIHVHQTAKGFDRSVLDSTSVDAQQDLTVSGLLGGAHHTLNGTQIAHIERTPVGAGTAQRFVLDVTQQLADVVLANSTDPATAWPLSGTLSEDVTESLGGTTPLHVRTVIGFTGTSKVQLTVAIGGVTSPPCTVDLVSAFPNCQ